MTLKSLEFNFNNYDEAANNEKLRNFEPKTFNKNQSALVRVVEETTGYWWRRGWQQECGGGGQEGLEEVECESCEVEDSVIVEGVEEEKRVAGLGRQLAGGLGAFGDMIDGNR